MKFSTLLTYFAKFKINLACFIFVIYQTHNCIEKYLDGPKGTASNIKRASLYPFTGISFCAKPNNRVHVPVLQACNLTRQQYFKESIWIGNGSESFCNDPKMLFSQLVENAKSIIEDSMILGFNILDSEYIFGIDEKFWDVKEDFYNGICFTFKVPRNREVWTLIFELGVGKEALVAFSPPNDLIGTYDAHTKLLFPDHILEINMEHEVSSVLDLDGEVCTDDLKRDDCVANYLIQV